MKFELRKIECSARLSEETHCYSAQLWIDGKHAFDVSNHGHGAADDVRQVGDLTEKEVNADIAHTRGIRSSHQRDDGSWFHMVDDIEIVCGELMNDHLLSKDLKRLLKRSCAFFDKGKLYTCGKPYQIADVKKKYPSAVFLNDKPFDEAFALFAADARRTEGVH